MMKKGISLIVLVITIIVMIILAASVVITLSNTGVINRASQAVDLTNEAAVQDLAALTWADVYMDNKRGTDLVNEVTTKLGEQGVTTDKWNITVTDTGVSVTNKNSITTLGSLVKSAADYGKTINYTVTVDGVEYNEWQVYYEDEANKYVYIITKDSVKSQGAVAVDVTSLSETEKEIYKKFQVGNGPKYTLTDSYSNSKYVASLIKGYEIFSNNDLYGNYVIGSIGGPTIELIAAGWNAKGYEPQITLTTVNEGYKVNGGSSVAVTSDGFYVPLTGGYWLTSTANITYSYAMYSGTSNTLAGDGTISIGQAISTLPLDVRPVVCLSADIPAAIGTTTDFSLVK